MFSVSVSIIFDFEWMTRVTRSGVLVLEVSCKILHTSFFNVVRLQPTMLETLVHMQNPPSRFPLPFREFPSVYFTLCVSPD